MYCQALSGNEYNTAGDTGSGGDQDGWLFLSPCSVRFFFPYFHRKTKQKQQQKKSRVLLDEYFPSLLIEKKHKGFFAYFQSRKGNMWALRNGYFFLKSPVFFFFFWKHKKCDKKKRYPGVDIKLYIAALHIKKYSGSIPRNARVACET